MNVLAIDQGTSATKAIVVGDGGRVRGEGSAPVHPKPGPGGAVEQDPQVLRHSNADHRRLIDARAASRRHLDGTEHILSGLMPGGPLPE